MVVVVFQSTLKLDLGLCSEERTIRGTIALSDTRTPRARTHSHTHMRTRTRTRTHVHSRTTTCTPVHAWSASQEERAVHRRVGNTVLRSLPSGQQEQAVGCPRPRLGLVRSGWVRFGSFQLGLQGRNTSVTHGDPRWQHGEAMTYLHTF